MAEAVYSGNAFYSQKNSARFPNFFPFRSDVTVHKSGTSADGSPNWILHDPAAGVYLKIGWLEREIIKRWHIASPVIIAQDINQETSLSVSPETVEQLASKLLAQGFLRAEWQQLAALHKQQMARRSKGATKFASAILFPRFPLVRPQGFLKATYPLLRPLLSGGFLYFTFGILAVALFMVSRQLSEFTSTFAFLFSTNGIIATILVLIASKVCHELAHAYVATKYGVSVPVMGIGLFVLFPILYTETSNAWLVPDRKARISIAMAGMLAEMVLATYALFLWSFAPVGVVKSILFVMASTIWVLSLLVNLNPLVRFDGYFILSDLLKVDNLAPRAFALGKFILQKLLTGAQLSNPETGSSRRLKFWLSVYFLGALAYRFMLFIGICTAMLIFLPTIAALPLCLLVLSVFVAKPVGLEFTSITKFAWKNKSYLYLLNLLILLGLMGGFLFLPVRSTITGHAIISPGTSVEVFAAEPGSVEYYGLENGRSVIAGEKLLVIHSSELEAKISGTYARMKSLEKFVQRQITDQEFLSAKSSYAEQLLQVQELYQGLLSRKAGLTIKAPISGVMRDIKKANRLGQWINTKSSLARIVSVQDPEIITFINERDISKISNGARASLIVDGLPETTFSLRLVEMDPTAQSILLNPILASVYGGPIPVRFNQSRQLVPETGIYRAIFVSTDAKAISSLPRRVLRGQVHLEGSATPLIGKLYPMFAGVLLREIGISLPNLWGQ